MKLANILAQAAVLGGKQLLKYHDSDSSQLRIRLKQDQTLVSLADEESEQAILNFLAKELPDASIYSEEKGKDQKISNTVIYVDPLDGTNPFLRKQFFSSVGLALRTANITIAVAICLPFFHQLLIAEKGKDAYLIALDDKLTPLATKKRIHVSAQNSLEKSVLYFDASFYPANAQPKLKTIDQINQKIGNNSFSLRMVGSNITQQAEVALGKADITITDCVGGPYDFFAGELLITEAGGKFTDLAGMPVTEETNLAIGSNGKLHDQILQIMKTTYKDYQGFR